MVLRCRLLEIRIEIKILRLPRGFVLSVQAVPLGEGSFYLGQPAQRLLDGRCHRFVGISDAQKEIV